MIRLFGFTLFAAAAVCAIISWYVDRQLQRHRLEGKPPTAYLFVPIRWKRELYRPEGHQLVEKAWGVLIAMYALAFAGMVLIAIGS